MADRMDAVAVFDHTGRLVTATERFRALASSSGLDSPWAQLAAREGSAAWTAKLTIAGRAVLVLCERAGDGVFVQIVNGERSFDAGAETWAGASRRLAEATVHDARNVLSALSIRMEVVSEREGSGSNVAGAALSGMRAQVTRLEGILRRHLRFASPSNEPASPVELAELVAHAVDACGHDARRRGVDIELDLRPPVLVTGNPRAVAAATLALVLRGLDVGRGGTLRIAVRAEDPHGVLTMSSHRDEIRHIPEADAPLAADGVRELVERAGGSLVEAMGGEGLLEARLRLATP